MTTNAEADRAIAELNGRDLDGRALNVNEARPKRTADLPAVAGAAAGAAATVTAATNLHVGQDGILRADWQSAQNSRGLQLPH
jgi:hypothetical protein